MDRPISFVTIGLVMLLLSFAAQPAYGVVRDYDVWLKANDPKGGALKPHLGYGRGCSDHPKPPHAGCMEFEEDTIGTVTFSVRNSNWKKLDALTCPDDAPGNNYKVITSIEVTITPDKKDPVEKGDFSGGIDGTDLKQYAFPQADGQGYIYKVNDKSLGLSEVTVVNMNSHPASDGVIPFWYRVTVEDCNSETTWTTDPRGDNQGRN